MKNLIILMAFFLIILNLEACASGSLKPRPRKKQDKMWHFCQDFEQANPIGKVCSSSCLKRVSGKCKKWDRISMDLTKKEDFYFFRNGAFIVIDEDQIK